MKVEAKWTGKYPNLCSGEWILKVNNIDVSHLIPKELKNSSMDTYGIYQTWRFTDDWDAEFNFYEDGLDCENWIEKNKYWLNKISTNLSVQKYIYHEINTQDFRCGSCGGCI